MFLRDTCRREAVRRGVTGYVRNEPDGTVTAEFEGTRGAVDAMVAWSRHGPKHAVVEHVDVEEIAPAGRAGFGIR
ncbi:acylphosphatase [Nocardioidaceae bacterium SCSIO 66511]|nr:acylphosphatase [Nocardioidaceae bacterium SCSIO 66511]